MSMADMRAYELETNEALERRRVVSVSDGATGRTIWTETRELVGEEIVSTVFDSLHNPRWTIHRPTRGWYLHLRRVPLTRQTSSDESRRPRPEDARVVELRVVKRSIRTRPEQSGVEFEFCTDTLPFPIPSTGSDSAFDAQSTRSETRVDMSPTVEPFFPSAREASTSATSTSPTRHRRRPSSLCARPVDPPSSATPTPTAPESSTSLKRQRFVSRFRVRPLAPPRTSGAAGLLRRLKNLVWEDEEKGFECMWWSSSASQDDAGRPSEVEEGAGLDEVGEAERAVMRFVERPSSFLRPRLSGALTLSPSLVDASTLEPSFWVALACAVCECEEEREGWEAARDE